MIARLLLILALSGLGAGGAAADIGPFGAPRASYTADATITVGRQSVAARIFGDGPRERRETIIQGVPQIFLLDQRARTAVLLMPGARLAIEADIRTVPGAGEAIDMRWTTRPLGAETVAGVHATRHRVDGVNARGDRLSGEVWLTRENIPVRVELEFRGARRRTAIRQELHNLKVGPVDPRLLRVPAGFRRLPMPAGLPSFAPRR
ncbi:MAG: hypothetical protein IT561_08640 [Alphaproteobacteria bacterium]|nr:hypothetical protein [Alphaproteobacteria bacterium]